MVVLKLPTKKELSGFRRTLWLCAETGALLIR